MSSSPRSNLNWYPTERELDTPAKVRAALQQVLRQHYELVDKHQALQAENQDLRTRIANMPVNSNGPANTVMLGLPVQPVDAAGLSDGAKLTWVKAKGTFVFQ